ALTEVGGDRVLSGARFPADPDEQRELHDSAPIAGYTKATMEKRTPIGKGELVLTVGDITRESTDAIANAANALLGGGGAVDGATHRAAGPELLTACQQIRKTLPGGRLATGGAVATPGFKLRARHVIHCVGPIYDDDRAGAADKLGACFTNALRICR